MVGRPQKMTLSGLVPGRLTNRLVLRTRAPRGEEVELRVAGEIDDPHPPAPDFAGDFVRTDLGGRLCHEKVSRLVLARWRELFEFLEEVQRDPDLRTLRRPFVDPAG